MSLAMHEIIEANHRILNPFTHAKLMLLGEVCHLQPGMRQLDLACGKAEMLCQWAKQWGIHGVGVDISQVFLAAAHARAEEMDVAEQITLVEADAGSYIADAARVADQSYDIVSCIGATWIGNGLIGTLKRMRRAVKADGLLLVGEPYWIDPPPDAAIAAMHAQPDDYTSLAGTLDRFESIGLDLVEMVLADHDSWDRYSVAQWWTFDAWRRANPDHPQLPEFRANHEHWQRAYLEYGRRYFGWGVFVLRLK